MKRMRTFFALMGLALCCWLVWRQSRQSTAGSSVRDQRALDTWQESIRLDPRTNYREKRITPPELAAEEARQRPQEGRN